MLRVALGFVLALSLGAVGCGDGSGGSGGSAGSGGTGGAGGVMIFEPGPTCIAFCEKAAAECGAYTSGEGECVQSCEGDLAAGHAASEACGNAIDVALQCAAELDCQAILDRLNGESIELYPCRSEVEDVDEICLLN